MKNYRHPLDQNHTHFILVDDEICAVDGKIDFKDKLLEATQALRLLGFVVVFGGEVDTIKTVSAYLQDNSICIFIDVSI